MASSEQIFHANQNGNPNSVSQETSGGPPIYSLLDDEQPIDVEKKNKIPEYAAVDKSRMSFRNMSPPPPLPKALSTDVINDGTVFPGKEKSTGSSNVLTSSEPKAKNGVQLENATESCYSFPYVNVRSNPTKEKSHASPVVAESSFSGRFSGILRKRGLSFTDGGQSSTDAKSSDNKWCIMAFMEKYWTYILMSSLFLLLSVCILAALIEITELKRELKRMQPLTVRDLEQSLKNYTNIYSNRTCNIVNDLHQNNYNSAGCNETIAAFDELLDKYHRNFISTCSVNNLPHEATDELFPSLCQLIINSSVIRVIELDMSNTSSQCPANFIAHNDSRVRLCKTMKTNAGCSSVFFSTQNMTYSKVFGRIKAYQFGNTNSFAPFRRGNATIDEPYVDGVSLTYGRPRQHIWSFAADNNRNLSYCPCSGRQDLNIPEFLGDDYFCDTGDAPSLSLALTNPLWDGTGCGMNYPCCTYKNPPWFYKQLPAPTSEPIEVRVCRDQFANQEDVYIEAIYIYTFN